MDFVKNLAKKAHRSRGELGELTRPKRVWAKYALMALMLVASTAFFAPGVYDQLQAWKHLKADVPIARSSWRVVYGASEETCLYNALTQKHCLASPLQNKLWTSKNKWESPSHRLAAQSDQGLEYWVGTTISPEALKEAYTHRANHLVLGQIFTSHHIWVNGELVSTGSMEHHGPVIVPLAYERLNSKTPLNIALQVKNVSGHPWPDAFASPEVNEGFLTADKAKDYETLFSYRYLFLPTISLLMNLFIAAMFFFFWTSQKTKQEYFYLSAFATVRAVGLTTKISLFALWLPYSWLVNFSFYSYCLNGCFAFFLGLSFSRVRGAALKYLIPTSFVVSTLMMALAKNASEGFSMLMFLNKFVIPALTTAGALSCFLQAYYLQSEKKTGTFVPVRIRRLVFFGLSMLAITGTYIVERRGFTDTDHAIYFYQFANLGVILVMCLILFQDYREQNMLAEKTPVSEYHKRPVLPAKLTGAVFVADLKNSEPFYRLRAVNDGENLVSIWRSHFYSCVLQNGGIVLHKKGDEIIGFFDADKCSAPLASALKASDEMYAQCRILEDQFKAMGIYPSEATGLHFRASLTLGEIRPVWEQMGSERQAYWEEAGNSSPFVEASRLLEMERQFPEKLNRPSDTFLIMAEKSVAVVEKQNIDLSKYVLRNETVASKHGDHYMVAVYCPGLNTKTIKSAA